MDDMVKRISITIVALSFFGVLAAGSGTTPSPTPGPTTTTTTPTAPTPPAATGLGSPAEPRSCDLRESQGKCRQALPRYFSDFGITDEMGRETCTGPGGTWNTAACPAEGALGHCTIEREEIHYYPPHYGASAAQAECTAIEHGTWTAAAP
jgi:hypothetical protein